MRILIDRMVSMWGEGGSGCVHEIRLVMECKKGRSVAGGTLSVKVWRFVEDFKITKEECKKQALRAYADSYICS